MVGSIFPYLLEHWGVANEAGAGQIPDTVRYSFWAGGVALFAAVMWTIVTTREYSPEEVSAFDDGEIEHAPGHDAPRGAASRLPLRESWPSRM